MRHAPALVNPSETVRKLVALTGSGLVLGI
jgi:hypothetical protein